MIRGVASSLILAVALISGASFQTFAANQSVAQSSPEMSWRNGAVDARIENWPLEKVLGRLASVSGWKVYVEPGLSNPTSVQFKNLPQGEALKLLLGDVNYALVPQNGAASKLFVYRNNLSDAVKAVAPDAGGKPKNWLANEIILSVKPGSKEDIEKLAKQLGGKVVSQSDALHAYRLQFDSPEAAQAAREKLGENQDFSVQDNYSYGTPETPALARSSSSSPSSTGSNGAGKQVVVALVDTPIQATGDSSKMLAPIRLAGDPGTLPTDPTHGTAMAKVVWEQYPNAVIRPIDIYGSSSTTTSMDVAMGIVAAMNSTPRPDVINISSGGMGGNEVGDMASRDASLKGILLFAAAGNSSTDAPVYPAAYPSFMAVTAAHDGVLEPYANYGSFVHLANEGSYLFNYMGDNYLSRGTSPASAATSGQAASLLGQGLAPDKVVSTIFQKLSIQK